MLVGEERDLEEKRASFFCLKESNGEVVWAHRSYGDWWWTGIEGAAGGVLYVHGFATPSLPVHRGVIAVDIATGTRLWENGAVRFIRAEGTRVTVEAHGAAGSTLQELDSRTGQMAGDDPQGVSAISPRKSAGPHFSDVVAPSSVDSWESVSADARKVLAEHAGADAQNPEFLIDAGCMVFTFLGSIGRGGAEESVGGRTLLVIDLATGRALYRDALQPRDFRTSAQTFFVRNHLLLYVKDRATIVAVRLFPEG